MPDRNYASYLHLCPHLVPGLDVRRLALQSQDAFVWSRVDGNTSLTQLADLTGLSPAMVFAVLQHLETLGALGWPDLAPLQPAPAPGVEVPHALLQHAALQEKVDLDYNEKLRILYKEHQLETYNYWALLGVTEATKPESLKKAYYQASKAFHPDRYFGRKLGSFAARLQRIFEHIKLAADTLSEPNARLAYIQAHSPSADASDRVAQEERMQAHRQEIAARRQKSAGGVSHAERTARRALKEQNFTQARIWAERAVQMAPDTLLLHILAAEVCEATGDWAAARRHLESAASLDPNDNDVKKLLARLPHDESNRH